MDNSKIAIDEYKCRQTVLTSSLKRMKPFKDHCSFSLIYITPFNHLSNQYTINFLAEKKCKYFVTKQCILSFGEKN